MDTLLVLLALLPEPTVPDMALIVLLVLTALVIQDTRPRR